MIKIKVSIANQIIPPPEPTTTFSSGTVAYMHREDKSVFGYIRSCAPCPAVFTLKDDPHVFLDKQWQFYIRAINYNQDLQYVISNLGFQLAYCNGTGFGDPNDPRANWLTGQRLDKTNPQFDKVRTNSRCCLTGTEVLINGRWFLDVKTFDSTRFPPLKAGRTYPTRVEDVNPDDYLFMPQYNREMFLVCNIVNSSGEVVQFDNGGLYDWTRDSTPYTFLPHISNPNYGKVLYPLENLIKLPTDSPVPSPYRRN